MAHSRMQEGISNTFKRDNATRRGKKKKTTLLSDGRLFYFFLLLPVLLRYNWHITRYVCLRGIICDLCVYIYIYSIYCKRVNTVMLVNTSTTSHNYASFMGVRIFKIYFLRKFQLFNIWQLTTPWCVWDFKNLFIILLEIYTLWPTSPSFSPFPSPWLWLY